MNQDETRLKVLGLSIIGGLLVLLLAVAAGCSDSKAPTDTPPPPTAERRRPPPPLWQPDRLVARTEEASIAIHHIVIARGNVTFFYSVELPQTDSQDNVTISPTATLQASGPDAVQTPTMAKALYSDTAVSFGALSFGSFGQFDTGSLFFTLAISDLTVERLSDGTKRTIDGPWTIPVIKRNSATVRTSGFPHDNWDGRAHSDRRSVELSLEPGRNHGDSPIGRVVTRGFFFMGQPVYFMVEPDGSVTEISEERYEDFDEFLNDLERLPRTTVSATAAVATPTATATPMPIATVDPDLLERPPQGPGAEVGNVYPYTLYVHCGVRDAQFDGQVWMADPMLGNYNPPSDWTSDDSRGTIELVRDDLVVFKSVSGRTIKFIPWPSDVEWAPCF